MTVRCWPCEATFDDETLAEHLERAHLNELLDIEADPETEQATVRRRTGLFESDETGRLDLRRGANGAEP